MEIIELLKEERGSQELFGQGDLVDESDLASKSGSSPLPGALNSVVTDGFTLLWAQMTREARAIDTFFRPLSLSHTYVSLYDIRSRVCVVPVHGRLLQVDRELQLISKLFLLACLVNSGPRGYSWLASAIARLGWVYLLERGRPYNALRRCLSSDFKTFVRHCDKGI